MIGFWILAALLLLAAYAFFFPALSGRLRRSGVDRQQLNLLLYRQRREDLVREANAEDADALKSELDKDLLADVVEASVPHAEAKPRQGRTSLIVALVAAPLLGGLVYSQLGRPDLADFKADTTAKAHSKEAPGKFEDMIGRLAERLKNEPNNIQGWMLLARSYYETQEYDKAVEAYEKVLAVSPDNLDAKGFYAMALGSQAGNFQDKPAEIANEIIQTQPKNHNALWILGAAAAESGDAKKAEGYIRTLRKEFPKDSEDYKNLTNVLAQILGTGPAMVSDDVATGAPAATGNKTKKSIKVKVALAPALKKQAAADDTVFIFAKAASGPPMPLAIARKKVKDLPVEVTLDDTMAMTPAMNLSSFEQIIIGARVSKTGNALPAAGDLQGLTSPTAVKNGKSYSVQISQTVESATAPASTAAPTASAAESASGNETAAGEGKAIKVKVALADSLKDKAGAGDTVFIFAKASSGPPMPLAIVKKQVKDLPIEVTLDDSMAMVPGMNLSSAQQLIVGARVSKSGNALPAPGDLQGQTDPVAAMAGDKFMVEISKQIP
jgi:cytochrome c-type biogenesis protein CcmH